MDGVLLINKPAGMTSFDVVRECRKAYHEKKIGHTGTLDPEASGLLIVLLGRYTKLLPYCAKDRKKYHATFQLGRKYDTEDIWGNCIDEKPYRSHDDAEIAGLVQKFTGEIMQVPPMYSALKKNGKKLYEYARQGIEVDRPARPVTVFDLSVVRNSESEYTMDAVVSSGTYIRTLIADFAGAMGEYAAMSSLVRSGIEHLSLSDSCPFDKIGTEDCFIDPPKVLAPEWKMIQSDDPFAVRCGKILSLPESEEHVILMDGNEILAAYEKRDDGLFHCLRGLY